MSKLTIQQQEKLKLLQEHVLNTNHKCFQACIPHTNNIIFSTYTFIEGEPVITVVVRCPVCNQLTCLLYTANSYNTPIYCESFISIPFIRIFLNNYSPYPLTVSSSLHQYLSHILNNYYLYLQIRNNKRAKYVNIIDILDYCFENTLLIQPLLFLKHFMLSDNIEKKTSK